MVTRLRAGQAGVQIKAVVKIHLSSEISRQALGPNGYTVSFPWVKRPGRHVGYSASSTDNVKNEWTVPLFPLYVLMAWTTKT
jgi:hypothetical protein